MIGGDDEMENTTSGTEQPAEEASKEEASIANDEAAKAETEAQAGEEHDDDDSDDEDED